MAALLLLLLLLLLLVRQLVIAIVSLDHQSTTPARIVWYRGDGRLDGRRRGRLSVIVVEPGTGRG